MPETLDRLLADIRSCALCAHALPHGPRPIVQAATGARILVIGQAPGRRVHESGVPWDDPRGDRLRRWLGVDVDTFRDPDRFALVPMGFCYPGASPSGDRPPRPECAPAWHDALLATLPNVRLTLLLSRYAHARYLGGEQKPTLTETVRAWKEFRPRVVPLPHPSPRNNRWLRRHPWFEAEVVPYVRRRVRSLVR